jgi:hypothetical protein
LLIIFPNPDFGTSFKSGSGMHTNFNLNTVKMKMKTLRCSGVKFCEEKEHYVIPFGDVHKQCYRAA